MDYEEEPLYAEEEKDRGCGGDGDAIVEGGEGADDVLRVDLEQLLVQFQVDLEWTHKHTVKDGLKNKIKLNVY